MVKHTISLFSLFCTANAFCQDRFTKFVERKPVIFATQVTDTFHFRNPHVSLLIREGLSKSKIKSTIPTEEKIMGKIKYATTDEIRDRIAPNKAIKVIDSAGTETATVIDATDPLLDSRYFDEQTNDMLEVPQIVYVESGRVKSYVPFFSAKYAVFTSWGQKLGVSNAFNTGFNTDMDISIRAERKSAIVGHTSTTIRLDTLDSNKPLKQLYGQNLLQALWPHLRDKRYDIYRMDSMLLTPFNKLHKGLISQLSVPVYDADGGIQGHTKFAMETLPLLATDFNEMQLTQTWYYNEQKNILFSRITELVLYAPAENYAPGTRLNKPMLKILLK